MNAPISKWPKAMPELTDQQHAIRDDWMHYWHEVLPNRYGLLEKFNHQYPVANRGDWSKDRIRTLEIGAGLGAHIGFEDLSFQDYTALELRDNMAASIREAYPTVKTLVGDVQEHIDVPDGYFDRVVAVHVLEHLPNLPKALREIWRVLAAEGELAIVIPCEGGAAYEFARTISSKRMFEKRYKQSYDWCIKSEHVNTCVEIIEEIENLFTIDDRRYFPLRVPMITPNLVVGLTSRPKS